MDDIINSEVVFYFSTIENKNKEKESEGYTYGVSGSNGVFVDVLEGSAISLIHEARHASGYHNHEWDFDKKAIDDKGHYGLINYDLQDEFEAYRQQYDYEFYIKNRDYKSDDYIKGVVDEYKVNSSLSGIIPEYIQYSRSNPYRTTNK